MDVNEYMKQSLEEQRKTNALLEQLVGKVDTLGAVVTLQLAPNHEATTKTVGNVSRTDVKPAASATEAAGSTGTGTSDPADAKKASGGSAQPGSAAKAGSDKKSTPTAAPSGGAKPPTIDEARKALKAYAAVEGNEAAVELLASFNGAGSVTAVAEQGEDVLAELVKKCKGG